MFYRLAMKAIVCQTDLDEALLPNQFGVGTKGGVEFIIQLVRMATAGQLPEQYMHLTSFDATNAFNTMGRDGIGVATSKHIPAIFRAARWAYAKPSKLLVVGTSDLDQEPTDGQYFTLAATLQSAQGLKQGDPLSALLFSVGLRPYLGALIEELGPSAMVVAYLDNVFVLSSDPDMLDKVLDSSSSLGCPISFNQAKCKTIALDSIKQNGLELLGSCLGGTIPRQAFLARKVKAGEDLLNALVVTNNQNALILLRCCLQHNLRHLLRSLDSHDI